MRRLSRVLISGCVSCSVLWLLAGDRVTSATQPWPAARHDPQRTARADVRGPSHAQLRREYRMGEAFTTGEPVVSLGGRAYVTATYCIRWSGESCLRFWTTVVVITPRGAVRLLDPDPTHEYTETAPAIGADGTVFASRSDRNGSTVAFTPDGRVRWTSIGGLRSPVVGPDGAVHTVAPIPGPATELVRLDPRDGTVLSRGPFRSTPATELAIAADGEVIYGEFTGHLVAMDARGTVKWAAEVGSLLRDGPMVAPDGTVYVSTDVHVVAVGADGQERWRFAPLDAFGTGAGLALAADGTIYAITLSGVTAINPDGSRRWQRPEFGGALRLVAGADGSVFFASPTAVVSQSPHGNLRWIFPLLRPANTIFGLAIGGDGTLIAVGNRFAYALER